MNKLNKVRDFIKNNNYIDWQSFNVKSDERCKTEYKDKENDIYIRGNKKNGYIDVLGLSNDEYDSLYDLLDLYHA